MPPRLASSKRPDVWSWKGAREPMRLGDWASPAEVPASSHHAAPRGEPAQLSTATYPARKWRECWWNVIFLYPLLSPPKKKFTQAKRKKDPNKRMGAMNKLKKLWIQLARHRTFGPLASLLTRADRMVFFSTSTYWRPEIHGFCIKVYKLDLVEKPLSFHIIPLYWLVKNGIPSSCMVMIL